MTLRPTLLLAALAAWPLTEAVAQRPTSAPSADTAASDAAIPLPPPGFPSGWQSNLVLGGELSTQFQALATTPNGSSTKASVFNDTDLQLYANYAQWFSMNADVKLQRDRGNNINSYYQDRSSAFRSEGLTLNQLYATVRPAEGLSIYAGKIHPAFGSAYENMPGQFYSFATDYEQDERIGLGIQYALPEALGLNHARVSLEAFYLDTSVLSTSLLTHLSLTDPTAERALRYARNQFGPSNTGSLDSFTLALRGGREEQGLTYQVSFTREATADPTGRTETGVSVGAMYDPAGGDGIPLTSRIGVTPFGEYAHYSNFAGIAGLERHYLLAGLMFSYGGWTTSVAGGLRKSQGISNDTDHQENISFTYEVLPELLLGAGVGYVTVAGRGSWSVGPSVSYKRAF